MTFINAAGRPELESHLAPAYKGVVPEASSQIDVSVVMPCLNEEASVSRCVESALASLAALRMTGEVIVVDNASSDRSAKLAHDAGARVVHEPLRGYGNAYMRGLAEARGRFIVLGDSDGTYDFAALRGFVEPLMNGTDMVMGTRLRGAIAPGAMPWLHRYVGNPGLTAIMNLVFGSNFTDVYCGMRSLKKEAMSEMTLLSPGMEFALEMLVQARRLGVRIGEVPIAYSPRIGGNPKLRTWRDGLRSLRFILKESSRDRHEIHGVPQWSSSGSASAVEAES
jgi:glycosyltransferase involved in cell wall biosynthesis